MGEETSSQEPWAEVLKGLPSDQAGRFINSFLTMIDSAIGKSLPPAIDKALHQLGYTEDITGLVHLLAAKSNDSKEEVLRKALTLYGLALDAREKGNRLAIISPDDEIVHDVVGFESVGDALRPVHS